MCRDPLFFKELLRSARVPARWLAALLWVVALLLGPAHQICAQDAVMLHQGFLDLSRDEIVMNISAHPDDEDGAALACYRMKYGVKTYSILFTRGEGGQNEKGPELYEDLGVLRTAETEAAAKILGTEVHFLNLLDFGYSKTAIETFGKWGGQSEALRRLVYVIRKYKPDILFTNHNTIGGHGHHQAVAITAIAAFDAAGDTSAFPEQLKLPGIKAWQPRKLFFRSFGRSQPLADVGNNVEEVNPARKISYLEIAGMALREHKTQGMERADLRGFTRGKSLYQLVRSNSVYENDSTSFFGGIRSWDQPSVAGLRPLRDEILRLRAGAPRDSLLGAISSILTRIEVLHSSPIQSPLAERVTERWQIELTELLSALFGLRVSAATEDSVLVPRQRTNVTATLESNDVRLSKVKWSFSIPSGWSMNEDIDTMPSYTEHRYACAYVLTVGDSPAFTLPRRLAQYRPIESEEIVTAVVQFSLNSHPFRMTVPLHIDTAPGHVLGVTPSTTWLSPGGLDRGVSFEYTLQNLLPHKSAGWIRCSGPAGWKSEGASFVIEKEGGIAKGTLHVRPPDSAAAGEYALRFTSDFSSQDVTIRVFDAQVVHGVSVGVIKSFDDTFETALQRLHVDYKALGASDLANADLSRFRTILIDIRAYLARNDLAMNNGRLLRYVQEGGNLVVMYQREQEWKPEYAPLPFKVGRRRVADEDAPIKVLQADHPLLNSPNRITEADWAGWKQERGVYFPSDVPAGYTQLISTHDPDESELTTGYLVAHVGLGSYVYTSFVWYRQLKEAHPGAFRCFANMISYPVTRGVKR